jgi:hypothetical protein
MTQEGGEAGRRLRMWAPSHATAGPPARVREGMEGGKETNIWLNNQASNTGGKVRIKIDRR